MKNPKRSKIEVRAAEPSDVEALTRIFVDRSAYSQTLQLPLQSTEAVSYTHLTLPTNREV